MWRGTGFCSPIRRLKDRVHSLLWTLRGHGLTLRAGVQGAERDYFPLVLLAGFVLLASSLGGLLVHLHSSQQLDRELHCLALNIYHEARGEPRSGQIAVARVTLNRVASPRYPDTICEVVHQKRWDRLRGRYVSAFSWTELERLEPPHGRHWQRARRIARSVYHAVQAPELEGVLFYHARHIKPSWARHKPVAARIGRHVFYR